jgi:hypothetical protein
VRERTRGGRPQGQSTRGGTGRTLGNLDLGEIQGYANRLRSELGGSSGSRSRGGSGLSGSGLSAAASGLAGAASGLAGGSLAQRFTGGSDEGFENEVRERLDLMDERLRRLEDEMSRLLEAGAPGEPSEPPEGSEQEEDQTPPT